MAHCDGAFDPREKELISALLTSSDAALTDISAEELAGALRPEAARLFVSSAYLVAMADGTFSDAETASNSLSSCLSAVVAVRWLTV